MAQPKTVPFSKFLIYYGDGANPENFTKLPMAMDSRGFSRDVKNNNITVPDLANEDLTVWEQAIPSTITAQLSGKGVIDTTQQAEWEALIGIVNDYKITKVTADGTVVGHYIGPFVLSKFNDTASRSNIVNTDVTFDSAGTVTWTAGS